MNGLNRFWFLVSPRLWEPGPVQPTFSVGGLKLWLAATSGERKVELLTEVSFQPQ